MRSLIFLACVLTLVRLVASENEGKSISHQWKPSPQSFYDALFYLLEFVRTVACLFGNLVSALYFLLHAIVIASCELISSIFSYVKHAIKLLEFIVVSAWSTGPQLLELLYSIMGSIFLGIEYVGKSINTFSTSVCNHLIPISKFLFYSIQTLLSAFGQNTLTLLNAIFWAISETFSTLIACSTAVCNQLIPISKSLLYNIQALLRVFGQNILTMLNAVFWAISETFSTLITWTSSVCNQLIPFSKWLLCGIQALLCAIGQNTWNMLNAIFWAISETFSTLITCSTSVINQLIPISKSLWYNIQVLLRVFGQNILTMLNAVFWAISETFSTLITWTSSVCNQLIPFSKWLLCGIQALLCAIGQNTWNMLNAIFWAISETFSTLITCSTSVINQLIPISKSLWYNIQVLLRVFGQNILTMLNAVFWAISETFSTLIMCSSSVCNQLTFFSKWLLCGIQAFLFAFGEKILNVLNAIFWATRVIFSTLITELGRHYIKCIETLPNVASLALHYSLNVGRWTVVVLALVGFFLINCWVGVNVFSMTFELLKSSLHGVLAFFASFQVTSFPRQEKTTDEHEKPGHEPKDGRYLDLMEQLEREREQLEREREQLERDREQLERDRDENLCVVCQTERKNIVLMPCRHMCMCKNCCEQLMEVYGKTSCPLCCQSIASTLEIYT